MLLWVMLTEIYKRTFAAKQTIFLCEDTILGLLNDVQKGYTIAFLLVEFLSLMMLTFTEAECSVLIVSYWEAVVAKPLICVLFLASFLGQTNCQYPIPLPPPTDLFWSTWKSSSLHSWWVWRWGNVFNGCTVKPVISGSLTPRLWYCDNEWCFWIDVHQYIQSVYLI